MSITHSNIHSLWSTQTQTHNLTPLILYIFFFEKRKFINVSNVVWIRGTSNKLLFNRKKNQDFELESMKFFALFYCDKKLFRHFVKEDSSEDKIFLFIILCMKNVVILVQKVLCALKACEYLITTKLWRKMPHGTNPIK